MRQAPVSMPFTGTGEQCSSIVTLLSFQIDHRPMRVLTNCTIFSYLFTIVDHFTRYACPSQGATLRAGFPKDAKNHRVYAFLDESKLQALIKRGKAWTTKAKNCIQSMQTGRVMSAAHLLNLLEEAKSIKVNLSPEVRLGGKMSSIYRHKCEIQVFTTCR